MNSTLRLPWLGRGGHGARGDHQPAGTAEPQWGRAPAGAGGEIIEVTNQGEVAALLVPAWRTPYQRLLAAGKVRQIGAAPVDLRRLPRVCSEMTSQPILAEPRGDR